MKVCKLLLAMLGATVLLGSLVGSTSARSFSATSQTWRATWREVRYNGAFGNMTCEITLEGSLHTRTIAKTVGGLIGYISSATLGPCREGGATILRETLPWHMRYLSFTGTLPRIETIRENVVGFALRIREPLATCLGQSTASSPMVLTFNRNTTTGVVESSETGGTFPTSCGLAMTLGSNRAPVTTAEGARITLTLI